MSVVYQYTQTIDQISFTISHYIYKIKYYLKPLTSVPPEINKVNLHVTINVHIL